MNVVIPPEINDPDLTYRLRRDRPYVKVTFATGYSDELPRGADADQGNIPILLKPHKQTTHLTPRPSAAALQIILA